MGGPSSWAARSATVGFKFYEAPDAPAEPRADLRCWRSGTSSTSSPGATPASEHFLSKGLSQSSEEKRFVAVTGGECWGQFSILGSAVSIAGMTLGSPCGVRPKQGRRGPRPRAMKGAIPLGPPRRAGALSGSWAGLLGHRKLFRACMTPVTDWHSRLPPALRIPAVASLGSLVEAPSQPLASARGTGPPSLLTPFTPPRKHSSSAVQISPCTSTRVGVGLLL